MSAPRTARWGRVALGVMAFVAASTVAAEIPDALVVLEARPPARPGLVLDGLPPRFVLMEDGRVFVGGIGGVAAGQLDKSDMKALDKRLSQLKRMPGLGPTARFGSGEERYRLTMPKAKIDVTAVGAPASAPVEARVLSALIADLAAFDHPSLRPLRPAQFVASARAESLAGGCRPWALSISLSELTNAPRVVAAGSVSSWPTGAIAASVCQGEKRYAVTFRPLLPVERP